MKKLFTITFILLIGLQAWSTARVIPSKEIRQKSVKIKHQRPIKNIDNIYGMLENPGLKSIVAYPEADLGVTQYDLQTNSTLGNRFYMYPEGQMVHVWTIGMTPTSYPDRGTGYNYWDGTSWQPAPTSRIESSRTGWPGYAPAGANGEAVIAHRSSDLLFSYRENRFSGSWIQTPIAGPTGTEPAWPRMIASGPDNQYLHYIVNSYTEYNGQGMALLYSRSLDGGQTWEIQNAIIEELGPEYYYEIGADAYVMASRGETVAYLIGRPWMDLVLMKSNNNGETWHKTVIWQHPYPFYDFTYVTDTFYCVDNSIALTIDKDYMVHVAFGINKVQGNSDGTYYLYPYVDGIGYWNESRPPFSDNKMALCPYGFEGSEMIENYNLIGWSQDLNGNGQLDFQSDLLYYRSIGLSTMPSIYVDDQDNVYVAYASTTEGYDNGTNNFKHIWMRVASNKGELWSGKFIDIMSDISHIFDEGIWPQLGQLSDDNVYLVYNVDPHPGLALDGDHDPVDNHQLFVSIPKNQLGVGIHDIELTNISKPYPNPASDKVFVSVDQKAAANVSVELTNLAGQIVKRCDYGNKTAGTHLLSINTSSLKSGYYLLTVYSGTQTVTYPVLIQ
ncbi:MAG TPA: T9SS type A sorting domain-containing protein [Bacteroidales bacterium]|jgi:hypothetical protein|nr:T9SS type A sorting domain-containing protein [Bacteroidales bacterium]HOE58384.1 T9SS type A sorting domain-containing protein [Bacteroidales bacterium]HOR04084.1 T9SS type A sorting domain-containing protein [Bacteroidales bacterium]HOU33902.1 T9SS type A sorting domain-containing protein [Bacteroidales bacterium]HPL33383.1 T9SS type A sorting domain-containing protein [Bacteroidales bacterium]